MINREYSGSNHHPDCFLQTAEPKRFRGKISVPVLIPLRALGFGGGIGRSGDKPAALFFRKAHQLNLL